MRSDELDWITRVQNDWAVKAFERVGETIQNAVDPDVLCRALMAIAGDLSRHEEGVVFDKNFLALASDEASWPQACALFHNFRKKVLELEKEGKYSGLEYSTLMFQENVAKYLCNNSQGTIKYDDDCARWAIVCLSAIFSEFSDESGMALRDKFLDSIV